MQRDDLCYAYFKYSTGTGMLPYANVEVNCLSATNHKGDHKIEISDENDHFTITVKWKNRRGT